MHYLVFLMVLPGKGARKGKLCSMIDYCFLYRYCVGRVSSV